MVRYSVKGVFEIPKNATVALTDGMIARPSLRGCASKPSVMMVRTSRNAIINGSRLIWRLLEMVTYMKVSKMGQD